MKVDFLIVGTQKGGTSALYKYLNAHPKLSMARKKELHFFDDETNFAGKSVDYTQYHSFFSQRPLQRRLYGEATPDYMYWYKAPRRIWEYNPKMKFIIILRNPVDRAFSAWNMEVMRRREFLSFQEAIRTESRRTKEALPFQHRVYAYVDRGFYTDQIRRIWNFFPTGQTLFLKSEHLKDEHQKTLDRVCDFLGVTKMPHTKPLITNARPYATPIADEERAYLQELFAFEIKDLEQMLDWDCSKWLPQ